MAEKDISISYLRVIATVFVIAIHASTGFLYRYDADSFDWNYANWINAATRCAVPLFVMISGALLLHKDENTISFYRKRIPKLLYPFIFWTIIYTIYYFYRYTNFSILPSWRIWEIAWHKVLHGANAHLWYLYMIIGLYTAVPFLRKMVSRCSTKELEVFLVLWFVSLFFMNKTYNLPKFDLTFFSGYIGYLVLGYYLTRRKITWNKWFLLFLYACRNCYRHLLSFGKTAKMGYPAHGLYCADRRIDRRFVIHLCTVLFEKHHEHSLMDSPCR